MSEETQTTKSIGWILGKKLGMTQIFDEEGVSHAVSVVGVLPGKVVQVKNTETDGYNAVVVGCEEKAEKHIAKPQKGALKDFGMFSTLKEYRFADGEENTLKAGDKLDITQFEEDQAVFVRGTSKGKGFQGVVKRHGFAGGRRSHGQKHSEREPGSIGVGGVQRVFRGQRMSGRMGNQTVSVKNLNIVKIDSENNQLFIEGAVPGKRGALLEIFAQ